MTDFIPEDLVPHHIDYLKAKSAELGGDTLAQHTWHVLRRLSDQYRLRAHLASQLEDDRLWQRLYWACFLHDFGKAAQGFQERLANPHVSNAWSEGKHRHEVLSLAFIDWLFPSGHIDRLPVICTVISHHKDADDIFERYGSGTSGSDEQQRIKFLASQISPPVIDDLWRWLAAYGERWRLALGFPAFEPLHLQNRQAFGVDAICRILSEFSQHTLRYEDGDFVAADYWRDVHYRGLILTADHSASAGAETFPAIGLTAEVARRPLVGRQLRSHQRATMTASEGSAIMIAPTGSGKTEAALCWAAAQMEQRPSARLFYTLPYQASMNAMAARLSTKLFDVPFEDFERNHQITIQHSRATLKFYQNLMEADSGSSVRAVTQRARERKNLAQLHYFPIQVFSPYQMLKAAYSLKGYETLLVDYTNALFIFDEIHAYDPKRLALIITMIKWLREQGQARFLVMTATLPPTVRQALQNALPGCAEIVADAADFAASQRHIVYLHKGDLIHHLDEIVADYRSDKSVLVCCNQVARAQDVYRALRDRVERIMLLHGRFNGKDRNTKEQTLEQAVGVGNRPRQSYVIVATQVVEVSLNIDLDTLYTDPAPLEALLQRFGRVNRGRGEGAPLCPVHVFREPLGSKESKPYDVQMVEASLNVLEHYCQQRAIDEALVTTMLGDIYNGNIADQWWKDYQNAAREFEGILRRMKPYSSATPELHRQFYALFDGTQVLPADCEEEYYAAIEKHDYLGASQYLVNLSWGQYHQLKQRNLVIGREETELADHVSVRYDSEWGLDLQAELTTKDEDV